MTDEFNTSPKNHRLYRNKRNGVIAGVCAGLADYLNVDVAVVRIIGVVLLVFFTPATLLAYIVSVFVVPQRPHGERTLSKEEDEFWRGVTRRPEITFSNLKYRFRDLEDRLGSMETVVTSEEWRLRRQFRDLERQ
ncbi:MAG: envelope stress response membrane protein PspC [Maricaulaceae bacterium]